MQPEDLLKLEKAVEERGLTPHLQSEFEYYRDGVNWGDEKPTLGEFLGEWLDQHERAPEAQWLDAPSLKLLRQACIDTGIAKDFDTPRYALSTGFKVWFRKDKKRYVYDPD